VEFVIRITAGRLTPSQLLKEVAMDRYNKYVGAGKYQMPVVPKPEITKEELPIKWFNFKDSKSNYMDGFDESECGLHFFIGDERFDAVWKWPEKYIIK